MRTPTRIRRMAGVSAVAAALLLGGPIAAASAAPSEAQVHPQAAAPAAVSHVTIDAVGTICNGDLPAEAHDTLDLIDKGGPYPYPEDGEVFQNREGVLPAQDEGYYHEYTVDTPGSSDRGARRIVTGEQSQEDYYTSDHYETFDLIDFTC